jgi:ectoine hydroxylase-related dioxygenase (phytanoyl-CoA dioxygenase family)
MAEIQGFKLPSMFLTNPEPFVLRDDFAGANARAALKEQGYLVIDRIAKDEEVLRIREICKTLFETSAGFNEGKQFDMVGTDDDATPPKLPQIEHPSVLVPELAYTQFFADAYFLAKHLLGPEARFQFDHIIKKPALDGAATPWHQDEAFRDPAYDYNEITVWMPLQAVDQRNGCMRFIPGTHLGDVLPHRPLNDDVRVHALECYEGFDPTTCVNFILPAGGCTVHMGRTLHGAGPNQSAKPRYAYSLVFDLLRTPRATTRVFSWQQHRQTARMDRESAWRRSIGGIYQRAVRNFRRRVTSSLR